MRRLGRLIWIGFATGAAFSAAGFAVALAGAFLIFRSYGYDPRTILDRVGDGLFARTSIADLDRRLRRVEQLLTHAEVRGGARVASAAARSDGWGAARAEEPPRLAQGLPPLESAPDPKFPSAATISEVRFKPEFVPPVFPGLDRKSIDVCQDGTCRFMTLADAYGAANNGDVITIGPGIYTDCIREIKKSIAIVGRPGPDGSRPTFTRGCAGKAALNVSSAFAWVEGLQIRNIAVRDQNGACLRIFHPHKQVIMIRNIICENSENGILGKPGPKGAVFIESSLFVRNGRGGRAHGIYIDGGREVNISNTVIHSSKQGGHSLKVGAERLLISGSIIAALNARNSRAIDFYAGGVLYIRDSVIEQGKRSENHEAIALATEPRRLNINSQHAVYLKDNWLIYDDLKRCCRWLFQGRKTGEIVLEGNRIVGFNGSRVSGYVERGNRWFKNRREAGLMPYDGTLASLPRPSGWKK